jgi:steroid delta-isomerase-like uncharacterized protein
MSVEENKALARRFYEEVFNQGNLDVLDELVTQEHLNHDPTLPDVPLGPEGLKQVTNFYRSAFPDANITVEEQIAEGEKVVNRWRARGTHRAELMGVPPSGNRVEITGIDLMRISGGKIAETWPNYDALGMMQQIGAIPKPGQSVEASPT